MKINRCAGRMALALALSAACAHAAEPAATTVPLTADGYPRAMPALGAEKPMPPLARTAKRLDNGLEVWIVPRQGPPRVSFALALRGAGLAADAPTSPGFAGLLADLLSAGTTQRDSRALAEEAQKLGGGVGASASADGLTVSAHALASQAAPMMQLLAEVVRQPSFPASEVALAKANALEALKAQEAQPGYRAERALARATFGEHPYARTHATEASISATRVELLRAEHTRRFRPDHALLVITGRIEVAEAMAMAQQAFGSWQASGPPLPETPPARTNATPVKLLLDRPGSVQSTVRLGRPGQPANSADQVALRLTSTILGGGFSSRVNMNLREDKGYTYGASAGHRGYRVGGAVTGGADVRNEVTAASLQEFIKEYRRIGSELVPAAELQMNKRYVAGSYLISMEKQGAVAQALAGNWLVGLPADYLSTFVPAMRRVSAAQVRAMGAKFFAPETQSIVVVGDQATIAEQLKPFGEFKPASE
jgi:predicted Zn-dependent peptidase